MKKIAQVSVDHKDIEDCLKWSLKREAKLKHNADIDCKIEWKGIKPERALLSFEVTDKVVVKDNWEWLNEKDIDAGKWIETLSDTIIILKQSQAKAQLPVLFDAAIQELRELRNLLRVEIKPIKEKEKQQ